MSFRKWFFCLTLTFQPLNIFCENFIPHNTSDVVKDEKSLDFQALHHYADELFHATLYANAISNYQKLLEAAHSGQYALDPLAVNQIHFRIAQAYYDAQNYPAVITSLNEIDPLSSQELLLLAIAYRKLGEYDHTIEIITNSPNLGMQDDLLFERGLSYFLSGRLNEAKLDFENLIQKKSTEELIHLSRLYLARIALAEDNYALAETYLQELERAFSEESPLRYEAAYLRGEMFFLKNDFLSAIHFFTLAIPKNHPEQAPWYSETLYHLGWSFLKMGDGIAISIEEQKLYLAKAEKIFLELLAISPQEKVSLALGQSYLTRGNRLKEKAGYDEAEKLLSQQGLFTSLEGQTQALLLRAEAASNYQARDAIYRNLTHERNSESSWYPKGWYLRGLNDFEEGKASIEKNEPEEAIKAFSRAAPSLKKAFEIFKSLDNTNAGLALKYYAQSLYFQNQANSNKLALTSLEQFIKDYPEILNSLQFPDEIYYLVGMISSRIAQDENDHKWGTLALNNLKEGISQYPAGKYTDAMLHLLGTLYYKQQNFIMAEETFAKLTKQFPNSALAPEGLFWAARSAAELGGNGSDKSKTYYRQLFESYPQSSFAPEAYFLFYTYREYLQGDRAAIKHLQTLPEKYPQAPFAINAYYLIGLDYTRDRKSPEGKWIRKKNYTESIDAFQLAETAFNSLFQKWLIPENQLDLYNGIRYRATLERALANLSIAEESQGTKQAIYFEYAEEVLRKMLIELEKGNTNIKDFNTLEEESSYWLAQTCRKRNREIAAEKVLTEMLDKYKSAKITRGYFLSRTWYEKGLLAMHRKEPDAALQHLSQAENAAKGKILSTDQKLDLWIQQSICYRDLGELDHSLLTLSRVVNDDSISGLRLKAMYLRAEIYELQERPELARKQLEALSKKAGEWALKAKVKLEKDYGY